MVSIQRTCFPPDGSGLFSRIESFAGMKWSNWSVCSVSCGIGSQTRYLECLNLIGTDEPCPLNRTKHVEKRSCKMKSCSEVAATFDFRKPAHKYKMNDFIDNFIDVNQEKFSILQKHHIHEGILQRAYGYTF